VNQQRVVNVFLDDASSLVGRRRLRNNFANLVEVLRYLDALASVRVLAWLNDPYIFWCHL
jgi:hypothetical protein